MELVESHHENEWVFHDPTLTEGIEDKFDQALEAYDDGRDEEAEELARSVVLECPNHIDALHHIGLYCEDRGDTVGSYAFCQAAVAIGLHAIPAAFDWERDRIPWGILANRPFLRAYHTLGIHRMEDAAWQEAIIIFKRLLAVNPNDNQGVRYILPKCWFETNNAAAVIDLCELYPDDRGPDILYSKALALSDLKRTDEARAAVQECIVVRPLVAREILADRHVEPERKYPGHITVGGADEAWEYWRVYGCHWLGSKLAMDLLREATQRIGDPQGQGG